MDKKMFLSFIPWLAFSVLAARHGADGAVAACLVAAGLSLVSAIKGSKESSVKLIDPDSSHGLWTTIATERGSLRSELLIIPAAHPAAGPVARVELPRRVPAGLHGNWLPVEE